jgi:cholesterol oxidase
MSFWPNKGEDDPRPPLGSAYEPVTPVAPRRPAVPAGAPAELRLAITRKPAPAEPAGTPAAGTPTA